MDLEFHAIWIPITMAIYFTADTHFGHTNILKLCPNRQFTTIQAHDDYLIKQWNAKVNHDDLVFHLGDFTLNGDEGIAILDRLNGRKVLIVGNHDEVYLKLNIFRDKFYTIKNYLETELNYQSKKVKVVLFHYPIEEWAGYYRDAIHLHGHTHLSNYHKRLRKNVGIDSRSDLSLWEKNELFDEIFQRS